MGTVLALLLISTVSAMTLAGPRVLQVVGEDFPLFRALAKTNADGLPARAVYVQSGLALAFILTGSFESILIFAGFTLGLNSFMAVAGAFVLRWRQPERPRPYRIPLYPLPPLIYLGLTGWTMVYLLQAQTREALLGLAIVVLGLGVYAVAQRFRPAPAVEEERA
jgi:APA family basic amino acid/polyamine antiporter